jgi:hypothetical protein
VRYVALEIPLRGFGIAGLGQRRDAEIAGIQRFGNALDGAALAGGIAPFEDHQQTLSAASQAVLQPDQFKLQLLQGLVVTLAHDCLAGCWSRCGAGCPVRRDGRVQAVLSACS